MAKQNNQPQNSGFWFGLAMGGLAGASGLYFLGTEHGRERLRKLLDMAENMDESILQELGHLIEPEQSGDKLTVPDIHSVLDKIQSSIPTRNEVQKFFAKDGKILK